MLVVTWPTYTTPASILKWSCVERDRSSAESWCQRLGQITGRRSTDGEQLKAAQLTMLDSNSFLIVGRTVRVSTTLRSNIRSRALARAYQVLSAAGAGVPEPERPLGAAEGDDPGAVPRRRRDGVHGVAAVQGVRGHARLHVPPAHLRTVSCLGFTVCEPQVAQMVSELQDAEIWRTQTVRRSVHIIDICGADAAFGD